MAMAYILDAKGNKHYIPDLWDKNRKRWSYSNDKTGLPGLNLLAGNQEHLYNGCFPAVLKESFVGCSGTCSQDCPGCYAKKITRNIGAFIKFALNTIEAKSDPERFIALSEHEFFDDPIVSYKIGRQHDSGDFFSEDYFAVSMDMAKRHPETKFYCYTGEKKIVEGYGLDRIPENYAISCSPWEGVKDPIGNLPQFIYDDGSNPEISRLPHCPAVSKNGHRTGVQCRNCLHCPFAKRGDRWAVYAH